MYIDQLLLDEDKIPIESEIVDAAPPYSDSLASVEANTLALSVTSMATFAKDT